MKKKERETLYCTGPLLNHTLLEPFVDNALQTIRNIAWSLLLFDAPLETCGTVLEI